MELPGALAGLLEIGLNHYLDMNPDARDLLAAQAGKVLGIELHGLDLCLYCRISEQGIQILRQHEGPVDTWLRGTPVALARLNAGDEGQGLFEGATKIEGDIDLGRDFQALLDASRIDWEEQVSKLIGDALAWRAGEAVRAGARWGRRAGASLREDIRDYLQEETRLLVHPVEFDGFVTGVDALRDDLARLEARIRRLERRGGTP